MASVTKKQLEHKVAYLSRRLKREFGIDHYSPGGNPHTWRLVEKRGNVYHDVTNDRMTRQEFHAYLRGLCDAVDMCRGLG